MRRVSSARSCWKRLYPPRIALYLELDTIDKIYGVHVAVLLVETAKSVDDKVLHSCINKFEPFSFCPQSESPSCIIRSSALIFQNGFIAITSISGLQVSASLNPYPLFVASDSLSSQF